MKAPKDLSPVFLAAISKLREGRGCTSFFVPGADFSRRFGRESFLLGEMCVNKCFNWLDVSVL